MRFLPIRSNGGYTLMGSVFHPMTPIYESRKVEGVRITLWLNGNDVRVAPGIAYSDDGINWDYSLKDAGGSPAQHNLDLGILDSCNIDTTNWISSATSGNDSKPLFIDGIVACPGNNADDGQPRFEEVSTSSGTRTALTRNRLYCRFGLFVAATGTTAYPRGGVAAMAVSFTDLDSGTIMTSPVLVAADGDPASVEPVFTPMTDALATDEVKLFRLTYMVEAAGGCKVGLGCQFSNDGVTWGDGTTEDAWNALDGGRDVDIQSTDGINYPWSFHAVDNTYKFVRFGMYAENPTSETKMLGCRVSLRVDWRGY